MKKIKLFTIFIFCILLTLQGCFSVADISTTIPSPDTTTIPSSSTDTPSDPTTTINEPIVIKYYDYDNSLIFETIISDITDSPSIPIRAHTELLQYSFLKWEKITDEEHLIEYKAVYSLATYGLIFEDLEDDQTKCYVKSYEGESSNIIIPGMWEGKIVIKIGTNAFLENNNITSVTIEDNIELIERSAFCRCINLSTIKLPDTLITIDKFAFYECKKLKDISFPDSLRTIDQSAFSSCDGLENVTLNDGLTSINMGVFSYCCNLQSISLPDSITSIENYAFSNCSSLKTISLPANLRSIGDHAFWLCISLDNITLPSNIDIIDVYTFHSCSNLRTIILPEGLKVIKEQAFANCTNLTSITFPNNLERIETRAFDNCTGLSEIFIPKKVSFIDTRVFNTTAFIQSFNSFSGCNLSRIIVDNENPVYDSRNNCNAIIETSTNTLIYGCSSTIIPESVEHIGGYAFLSSNLLSIEIPSNIKTIGPGAFKLCENLNSVIINNGIESISECMFESCSSIESITLPSSVKGIGKQAFSSCTNLKIITLSENLTEIGASAFADCINLESIELPDGLKTIDSRAFMNCTSLEELRIPKTVTSIKTSDIIITDKNYTWVLFDGDITNIVDGCTSIERLIVDEDNPVYDSRNNCNAIIETSTNKLICGCKNTIISSTVIKIGAFAFSHLKMNGFAINSHVEEIEYGAFYRSLITKITIPDSVRIIGKQAFYNCESLNSVTLNNGVREIGDRSFYNTNIESIFIPQSVSTIGYGVFEYCNNLRSITIDSQNYYFLSEDNHNAIIAKQSESLIAACNTTILVEGVKIINSYSFTGLNGITEIIIPNGVTEILETFGSCDNLETIILPKTIERITPNLRSDSDNCKVLSLCTEEEWKNNNVWYVSYYGPTPLPPLDDEIYFYSDSEPEIEGRFWHYVDDVPTIWE